jgi:hypothetical protein
VAGAGELERLEKSKFCHVESRSRVKVLGKMREKWDMHRFKLLAKTRDGAMRPNRGNHHPMTEFILKYPSGILTSTG